MIPIKCESFAVKPHPGQVLTTDRSSVFSRIHFTPYPRVLRRVIRVERGVKASLVTFIAMYVFIASVAVSCDVLCCH